MRKTKIYFWCAAKDNCASQISEVVLRKARAVKIPISTIRAIIKNFQSTENVTNLSGRGRVLYRPNAWWGGEFEWPKTLKDHSWRIAEKLSLGVRKPKNNCQTAPTSPHVVWEGFKKNSPSSSKNNLQHIQLSDTMELQMGLASMVRWN